MSASAAQSNPNTTTTSLQQSVQGAAGANSPTISSGANTIYNDPALEQSALSLAGNAITAALSGAGKVTSQVLTQQADNAAAIAQNGAAQSSSQSDLLSAVLQQESQLATAKGTGGASLSYGTNNNLIYAAAAIAVAAIIALMFRKQS